MTTLADLFTTLETRGALKASRAKDMKTALRYLATALGHASLEACAVDAVCFEEPRWIAALDAHFQQLQTDGKTISAGTRRNVRNNVRVVFRAAKACGLLEAPLPPVLLTKPNRTNFLCQLLSTSPYQRTYDRQTGPRRFGLPQAEWPPDIQAGWRAYRAQCGLRLRESTFEAYTNCMRTYLGYFVNICGRTPAWDELFDVAQLTEFLRWHGARLQRPISVHGKLIVCMLAAMAVVLEHPARQALADVRNALPMPEPLHTKRAQWVSLRELDAVAEACFAEGRTPFITHRAVRFPGAFRASTFQRGLMLKLLVRVPLRQRNVRELRLDKHLYQDQAGHWHLHFSGSDLKIGERQGRINTYDVDLTDYCPEFIPVLEEFLRDYRPRLPGAATSKSLFLTQRGQPFSKQSLQVELKTTVVMRTGQRFYPHLIRTIWATEYLEATQDFTTAATMLGDTVGVVMKTYYDVVNKNQHAKAKAFLSEALRTG